MMYVKITIDQNISMCGCLFTQIFREIIKKFGSCNGVGQRVRSSVDTLHEDFLSLLIGLQLANSKDSYLPASISFILRSFLKIRPILPALLLCLW